MARVEFTPHLERHVHCRPATVPGSTVAEVLAQTFEEQPAVRAYVVDELGRARKHIAIFIDGEMLQDREALSDPVTTDSTIYVMQALSGG